MKNKSFYLILLSIFFFASCSSVPKPIPEKLTDQKKLEASQHWELLVKDFTKQISMVMQEKPWPLQNTNGFGHALEDESKSQETTEGLSADLPYIYIQANDISDFGKSFRSYLITELSNLGYHISPSREGAVIASWSVKKIHHRASRTASGVPGTNAVIAALGYGIYKVFDSNSSAFWGLVATGAFIDLIDNVGEFSVRNKVPHTEVILGFTLSKDTIILSRQTQAYYVNAEDFDHYTNIADFAGQESYLKPVTFKVTNY